MKRDDTVAPLSTLTFFDVRVFRVIEGIAGMI